MKDKNGRALVNSSVEGTSGPFLYGNVSGSSSFYSLLNEEMHPLTEEELTEEAVPPRTEEEVTDDLGPYRNKEENTEEVLPSSEEVNISEEVLPPTTEVGTGEEAPPHSLVRGGSFVGIENSANTGIFVMAQTGTMITPQKTQFKLMSQVKTNSQNKTDILSTLHRLNFTGGQLKNKNQDNATEPSRRNACVCKKHQRNTYFCRGSKNSNRCTPRK